MTKAQLKEKWQNERSKTAGEASKLNVKLAGLKQRATRGGISADQRRAAAADITRVNSQLVQLAARVVTIDEFIKDI